MTKNSQNDRSDEMAIDRRSYLKLTTVMTAVGATNVAAGVATAATAGYGAGTYGADGYGPDEETDVAPSVDFLRASESSPPNPHANIIVDWRVSDADGDLDSVVIDIRTNGRSVASETIDVSGEQASDTTEIKIKKGAGGTYDILLSVTDTTGKDSSTSTTVNT